MDGHTDGRMEFFPILQDFVRCQGCCPATLCDFTISKKQGKGITDLMMPFGDWFTIVRLEETYHSTYATARN